MNQEQKKEAIATFRFGVIADFVTGVYLNRGEKEQLLDKKSSRKYEIPFSSRTRISRSSILKWIRDYKKGGKRIEALYPSIRVDKGRYRKLDASFRLAVKEIKKENPQIKVPGILKKLLHQRIITEDSAIKESTIYRFLKTEKLYTLNEEAEDRRRFESEYSNQVWQSDAMHGPYVMYNNKKKKTYLFAILDDYSRYIIHAEFYLSEGIEAFRTCLQTAVLKRGLPQTLYVDNGSCFKSLHLEHIAAILGISIKHSRPYTPQGRGKIERWFRTVRESFLLGRTEEKIFLNNLNKSLDEWVEEYNKKSHGTTSEKPYERYIKKIECSRPAPNNLEEYFRHVARRKVKRDRTFRLHGIFYEAPVVLIDKIIELRYHNDESNGPVEIFFDGMSFGFANILDAHLNSKIGRNWMNEIAKPEPLTSLNKELVRPFITSGALIFESLEEETNYEQF